MKEEEEQLLRRCLQGEESAWVELINEYKDKVFDIAYRTLHNYEDAEEVAQETFVRLFKSLKTFRRQAQFSTWLYRIVINLALNRRRRQVKIEPLEESSRALSTNHNLDSIVLKKERQEAIRQAIQTLPPEYRIVVTLREYEEMSYDEIAEILKIPKGTVESRLHRARQILKERLKDYLKG